MNEKTDNHYDVIINGAGMVGATLACLLAQAGRKVAVIEAAKKEQAILDEETPYDFC